MASVKDQMIHIIHNQPDDSTYDEILKELGDQTPEGETMKSIEMYETAQEFLIEDFY